MERIYRLQGYKSAMRVLPIVWTIIWSVKGFSKFHAQEFEKARRAKLEGESETVDAEEAALTSEEYEEYGFWPLALPPPHNLGPTFVKSVRHCLEQICCLCGNA